MTSIQRICLIALLLATAIATHPATVAQEAPNDLRLWYEEPATVWEEALPVGCGRLGAMVFGGITEERIQFNEDTVWTGSPRDYTRAGAADHLDEVRRLVEAGKHEELRQMLPRTFLSDPIRQRAYQPLGDVRLSFPAQAEHDRYYRELDLDTAVATTAYRVGRVEHRREVFASYPDQVIVIRITASQAGEVNFGLQLDSPHPSVQVRADGPDMLVLSGQVEEGGVRFESRAQVRVEGGRISTSGNTLNIHAADAATLLLSAGSSFVNFQDISGDPAERARSYLQKIATKSYDDLRADHVADHQRLFRRVSFDLGRAYLADLPTDQRLELVNVAVRTGEQAARRDANTTVTGAQGLIYDPAFAVLYFQMGRYMLIASSRPGSQPANLQGVWNELLDPPWESKYTTNINVEMNYWPAEVANLAECHEPLFDMIDDLRISGSRTARGQYNAGGWVLHHNTDIWRGAAPINNVDGLWPTGAAWLSHHLWDHYLHSGDAEFLRNRAYPAMKQACEFFLDFLVRDPDNPDNGWLVTHPSHSPEQAPPDRGTLGWGPTIDNQLIRSLFSYTIEAAAILDIDAEFAARLVEVRKQLPPNQVGRHGQLQEWLKDWDQPDNAHRHMSALWGLYPGWDITPQDPEIYDAAKVLLKWRGDGSTGWSFGWRIPLWARAYDGDFALRQLYLQLARRTFPNLFDKCGPFQVDGNFGATGGIPELLLQSHMRVPETRTHIVHLLPALPQAWPDGSITGLRARGGFELDLSWSDGKLGRAVVRSMLGNPVRVKYGDKTVDLETQPQQAIELDPELRPAN